MNHQAILQEANRSCLNGQYDWARHCYDQLAELEPDDCTAYVGLGVIEFQQKNFEQAQLCFKVALRLDPNCCQAMSGLGIVDQKMGNYDQAAKHFFDAYMADRKNFTSLIGLCEVSKISKKYDHLKICLERYIEDYPDDTSTALTLACLHIGDGDYWKAELVIEQVTDAVGKTSKIKCNIK